MSKVTVTNGDIIDLINGLDAVNTHAVELPFKMFYAMGKTRAKLKVHAKVIASTIEKLRRDLAKHQVINKATNEPMYNLEGNAVYETGANLTFSENQNKLLADDVEIEVHSIQYSEFEKEVPKLKGFPGLHSIMAIMVVGEPGETPVKKLAKADA